MKSAFAKLAPVLSVLGAALLGVALKYAVASPASPSDASSDSCHVGAEEHCCGNICPSEAPSAGSLLSAQTGKR